MSTPAGCRHTTSYSGYVSVSSPADGRRVFLARRAWHSQGRLCHLSEPPVQVLTIPLPLALLAAGIPRGARRALAAAVPQVRAAGS
jgi:hypothetical protein